MSSAQGLPREAPKEGDEDTDQYLTFLVDGEEYGVDILRVEEIKCWEPPTLIPNTPDYVQGVINIRGVIVPVIDLRRRFNLSAIEYGPTTVVVVLRVLSEDHDRIVGLVVDGVSDVYDLSAGEIKPAPEFGGVVSTQFVLGLAAVNEIMMIVLDTDKLLSTDELAVLDAVSE